MSTSAAYPDYPQPGQVFHCPMHVHLPGIGYLGASEQVLVTETGCEILGDRDRTCERKLFVKGTKQAGPPARTFYAALCARDGRIRISAGIPSVA